MRDIAKNIRFLRAEKNMTQDELAEKLYVTRQTVSNYETGKSRPDVEMLARMAEVLETDVNTLIYGPQPEAGKQELYRLIASAVLTVVTLLVFTILKPIALEYRSRTYSSGFVSILQLWVKPIFFLFAGWTLAQLLGMALKKKPLNTTWSRRICAMLILLTSIWMLLSLWYSGGVALNDWLFHNHLRGEWVKVDGINVADTAWSILPPPIPEWVAWIGSYILLPLYFKWPYLPAFLGSLLWVFGFPKRKDV